MKNRISQHWPVSDVYSSPDPMTEEEVTIEESRNLEHKKIAQLQIKFFNIRARILELMEQEIPAYMERNDVTEIQARHDLELMTQRRIDKAHTLLRQAIDKHLERLAKSEREIHFFYHSGSPPAY